jgi:hypothetical protein
MENFKVTACGQLKLAQAHTTHLQKSFTYLPASPYRQAQCLCSILYIRETDISPQRMSLIK